MHQTFKTRLATMKYLQRVMENSSKRPRFLWYILLLCVIVQALQLKIAGCSQSTPYYHPDIAPVSKRDVATEGELRYRVLLLGDGGQPKQDEPVLKTLHEWARKHPGKTSIVFLGDNMYPEGMTARKRNQAEARLGPQLAVVKDSAAHGLFIPGNHDWASGRAEGYRAILAQEQFIKDNLPRQPNFLPHAGAPGPVAVELPTSAPVVRLIVLDTQWWLHQHQKPQKAPETVIEELKSLLDTELPVIVVGHHPLQTYGVHGGFFDWKSHLFPARDMKKWLWVPVPILGSLYPFARWHLFKSDQNLNGARNKKMVRQLKLAFEKGQARPLETLKKPLRKNPLQKAEVPDRPPLLIYAAGHEHSLQVLKGDVADYLLVSGLASSEKATAVSHGENTLFAHQHSGFMVVDFITSGKVLLRVVEPKGKGVVFNLLVQR